jgi:uncharacterized protein (DUF934 family)
MTEFILVNREGSFSDCCDLQESTLLDVGEITSFHELDALLANEVVYFAVASFADGRAFSLARQLRVRGFAGTVTLKGDLLPDQLPMARAAGVDSIVISADHASRCAEDQWQRQASHERFGYQRGLGRAASG